MPDSGEFRKSRRVPRARFDFSVVTRTGPGTLAGRYMRRFWQPVLRAQDLAQGRAIPLKIMSEDFTLYRGEDGVPHAVADRCPHRRTLLSAGFVEDDCIRCLYHGWKFRSDGQCIEQPAELDGGFAHKVRIKSYPTAEYLDLIFVFMGEGEPSPVPRFADFEEPGVVNANHYTRWCNYYQNDAVSLTLTCLWVPTV